MKAHLSKRFLALILVFALLIPCFIFPASASLETEYATPATESELNSVPKWFTGNNGAPATDAYAKIVDGTLYVWGTNYNYVLGITSYVDEDGNTISVANNTVVPLPTPVPTLYLDDGVTVDKITQVYMTYNATLALTENNNFYVWGTTLGNAVKSTDNTVPFKIDTSAVPAGVDIESFKHTGTVIYAKDSAGTWYTAGTGANGQNLQLVTTKTYGVLTPLPTAFYTAIGNRTVVDIHGQYNNNTVVVTSDGRLFGFGQAGMESGFYHHLGYVASATTYFVTEAADISTQNNLTNVKFVYITAEDQGYAAVDSDGNVWVWGTSPYLRFGNPHNNGTDYTTYTTAPYVATPYKLFNSTLMQKKAVRVYISHQSTYILCADNTVYAIGRNANGLIIPGGDTAVGTLTQVAENISLSETIVGVFPNNASAMLITKAGNMYFLGDNADGGAATGNTENASPGEVLAVSPTTLPPSEPLTANEVYFEIQHGSNTYVMNSDGTVTKNGTTKIAAADFVIEAGQDITLNVYFTDFGKLHTFTMPIRFDPEVLQVVNSAGVAYSNTVDSVTPSGLAGSGITQGFTEKTWAGGKLTPGGADETYPKISNADGWITVGGYTNNHNAAISGTVKMFSVDFTTINMMDTTTTIEFAYDDNCYVASPIGYGYDPSSNGLDGNNYGPYWTLHNEAAQDLVSAFDFNTAIPFPTFSLNVETLTRIELKLYYGNDSNLTEVADTYEGTINDQTYAGNKAINWSNKDITYTLKVIPNPSEASFPQVNWTYSLLYPLNELEDYISIIETGDTYIKFKISDTAYFTDTDPMGLINFTASAKMYQGISADMYVVAKSFEAPETLRIAEKWDLDTDTIAQEEFIYDTVSDDIVFNVDYGEDSKDEDPATPQNPQVVWTLLDQYGNELDLSDPECEVTFNGIDLTNYAATLRTHYSTSGDSYIILRAASLYDSAVYDEVRIKVHLKATSLAFTQEIIRMPLNFEKELATYLSIMPNDVYETDLVWSIESQPERDPSNAPEGASGPFTYAANIGSKIYSYGWSTPVIDADAGYNEDEYVVVKVYDNISGQSATVNISILDLNSPLSIDDIEAVNNLGTDRDVLRINLGLEEGDILVFRYSYGGEIYMTTNELLYEQTPSFTWVVAGLYEGMGGEISVQLKREIDGALVTYDEIPISYTAEPSLVYGYARLLGKEINSSANEGIRVVLKGDYHDETVFTGEGGYFQFTQYIPPGTYTIIISDSMYLTRNVTVTIPAADEFIISSYDYPIYIYPGELTGDNGIDARDYTIFVSNWLGQYNPDIPNFDLYDFKETAEAAINMLDLELMLMRDGWTTKWYPEWNVPIQ